MSQYRHREDDYDDFESYVDYRGVDQRKILTSLRAARDFLSNLHLGKAVDAEIRRVFDQKALDSIDGARTPRELTACIQHSGVQEFLTFVAPVFRYHALHDRGVKGHPSLALKIYSELTAWGALSSTYPLGNGPMQDALNEHLYPAYLQHIEAKQLQYSNAFEALPAARRRMNEVLEMLGRSPAELLYQINLLSEKPSKQAAAAAEKETEQMSRAIEWLRTLIPYLVMLKDIKMWDRISQVVADKEKPMVAKILPGVLYHITGQKIEEAGLPLPPVERFVLPLGKFEDQEQAASAVERCRKKLLKLMQPYMALGEMEIEPFRRYRQDGTLTQCIVATRAAAAYLAGNSMSMLPVEDMKGKPVKPSVKLPPRSGSDPGNRFNL